MTVQEIANETKCYALQFRNSMSNHFSKRPRVNDWQPVTAEEIYNSTGIFHAYYIEAQSQTAFLMKPAGSHAHFWLFPWIGLEESADFFIDNTSMECMMHYKNYSKSILSLDTYIQNSRM
jgi:hypothetical protein